MSNHDEVDAETAWMVDEVAKKVALLKGWTLRKVVLGTGREAVYEVRARHVHEHDIRWYGVQRAVKFDRWLADRGRREVAPDIALLYDKLPVHACGCQRCGLVTS